MQNKNLDEIMRLKEAFTQLKLSKLLLSLTLVIFTFSACQQKEQEVEVPSDAEITEAVKSQFSSSEAIPAEEIQVETEEGIVTLNGSISNLLAKKRATEMAQSIHGVLSVVNNLIITESRPDEAVENDIAEAIATDPATEFWEITASVNNGVARLKGVVDSWQEKQLAGTLAKGVKGVKEVKNTIIVNPKVARSDEQIKKEVKQTLMMNSRIRDNMIEVQVDSGRVALSGAVGSAYEKQLASDVAHVTGVESVEADLLEVHPEYRSEMLENDQLSVLTADQIKDAIQRALAYDPRVPEEKIEVTVEGETAILSGTVNNLNTKLSAESDARHTAGISSVENNISVEQKVIVEPETPVTDDAIKSRIILAVQRDPYVEEAALTVSVESGLVTLEGDVNSEFEKEQIEKLASNVKGVIAIDNNLKIIEGSTI